MSKWANFHSRVCIRYWYWVRVKEQGNKGDTKWLKVWGEGGAEIAQYEELQMSSSSQLDDGQPNSKHNSIQSDRYGQQQQKTLEHPNKGEVSCHSQTRKQYLWLWWRAQGELRPSTLWLWQIHTRRSLGKGQRIRLLILIIIMSPQICDVADLEHCVQGW